MKIVPYTDRWNEGERDWSYVKDARHDIENWEHKTGLLLPTEYRDFMFRFNGGRVYPRKFSTVLASQPSNAPSDPRKPGMTYVGLILSWAAVELRWRGGIYGKAVPPQHLIVADTPGPIQILMSMNSIDYGKIFSWCHSQNIWGTDGNDTIHFQSDSFASFVRSLTDEGGADFKAWRNPTFDKLAREFEI